MARTHHLRPSHFLAIRQPISLASFHHATRLAYPRAGAEDKDSINRESMEYARSGSDDQAAAMGDAAFDPDMTSPEEQKKAAGEGDGPNPLDVSPANPEVSKPRGTDEGGAQGSSSSSGSSGSERKRSSGKGASAKNGST